MNAFVSPKPVEPTIAVITNRFASAGWTCTREGHSVTCVRIDGGTAYRARFAFFPIDIGKTRIRIEAEDQAAADEIRRILKLHPEVFIRNRQRETRFRRRLMTVIVTSVLVSLVLGVGLTIYESQRPPTYAEFLREARLVHDEVTSAYKGMYPSSHDRTMALLSARIFGISRKLPVPSNSDQSWCVENIQAQILAIGQSKVPRAPYSFGTRVYDGAYPDDYLWALRGVKANIDHCVQYR